MNDETRAYLRTLVERVVPARNGLYRLMGPISPSEYAALRSLLGHTDVSTEELTPTIEIQAETVQLDTAFLSQSPVTDGLLCVDFGTAASKIGYDPGGDRYEPLAIGTRDGADFFWVRSAIAMDAADAMVFGMRALEAAVQPSSPLLTSFKSKLWGDPAMLDAVALKGAGIPFTYRDCIQAYLAYLTFLGAEQLEERGASRYTPRRYAMPFAYDDARRKVREALGEMLGRAMILADTLGETLATGVDATRLRGALDAVANLTPPAWFLHAPGCAGEPVAAGNLAMDEEIGTLTV